MSEYNPFDEDELAAANASVQYSESVCLSIDNILSATATKPADSAATSAVGLPSLDAVGSADFDIVTYINDLFPTEKSLANLDEEIGKVTGQISDLDIEIAKLVQQQGGAAREGKHALEEAKLAIQELFTRIREIRANTDLSDSTFKEMTREIKKYDVVKQNLTEAITTLHHLDILLDGLESLSEPSAKMLNFRLTLSAEQSLIDLFCFTIGMAERDSGVATQRRQYDEIARGLPAVLNVLTVFEKYMSVPQVRQLANQVEELKKELTEQVASDFKSSFGAAGLTRKASEIHDICAVASILEGEVKGKLSLWFISQQLREYLVLYGESEDAAWLDKVDQRYRWFINKLTEFESSGIGNLFPSDWNMERRMTEEFCSQTGDMLDRLMTKRAAELDARLLTHAVQQTAKFESLLSKRFPPISEEVAATSALPVKFRSFYGAVWKVFENHLYVFVQAQDKNFRDFLEQKVSRFREGQERPRRETSAGAGPLPSSGELFLLFKRTILEANKISTTPERLLTELCPAFKKSLKEYAYGCLTAFLPRINSNQVATTAGLIQSLLREGEVARLSADEQFLCCSILATADWCAETTLQLQTKLREKLAESEQTRNSQKVDLSQEQDLFYNVSSSALTVLVQDVESACDAALLAMTKTNWATLESVGDESAYVASIRGHLSHNIPRIRDWLSDRRKYFAHFCNKFASQFTAKFTQALYKCRPCGVSGAEQLLLDTHSLKICLMELPSLGSVVAIKPPSNYVNLVTKTMTHTEMVLKLVMQPIESHPQFLDHYLRMLPDSDAAELQKMLDMKAIRRSDQAALIDLYRSKMSGSSTAAPLDESLARNPSAPLLSLAADQGNSRIRRLERLVKKKL